MIKLSLMALAALLLAGCAAPRTSGGSSSQASPGVSSSQSSSDGSVGQDADNTSDPSLDAAAPTPEDVDPSLINRRVSDFDSYMPPRLLGLDAIAPIYNPEFARASEAPLESDELVIGIELDDQAKAYPISVLRFREMVNDELAGWPILVTY